MKKLSLSLCSLKDLHRATKISSPQQRAAEKRRTKKSAELLLKGEREIRASFARDKKKSARARATKRHSFAASADKKNKS